MDEVVDDLAIDEVEDRLARLDQRHRDVEGREDGRILDTDDPTADDGQRPGQAFELQHLVAVENALAVERHVFGRCGRVPTEISALAKPASDGSPVSAMRATELGPVNAPRPSGS